MTWKGIGRAYNVNGIGVLRDAPMADGAYQIINRLNSGRGGLLYNSFPLLSVDW